MEQHKIGLSTSKLNVGQTSVHNRKKRAMCLSLERTELLKQKIVFSLVENTLFSRRVISFHHSGYNSDSIHKKRMHYMYIYLVRN